MQPAPNSNVLIGFVTRTFLESSYATPREWAAAQGFDAKAAEYVAIEVERQLASECRRSMKRPAAPPAAEVAPQPAKKPAKPLPSTALQQSKKLPKPKPVVVWAARVLYKAGGELTQRRLYDELDAIGGIIKHVERGQVSTVNHVVHSLCLRGWAKRVGETGETRVVLTEEGASFAKELEG